MGVSTRMYNDSNSLGDRAKECRGSKGRHAVIHIKEGFFKLRSRSFVLTLFIFKAPNYLSLFFFGPIFPSKVIGGDG